MLHVVTDSSCDLPYEQIQRCGLTVVPLSVAVDGEDFHEGVDLTPREFYEKMARGTELPKTAAPSPGAFAETFSSLPDDAPVICITISSKLSGTYQSACLGRDISDRDVAVFDSLTASPGQGLQVLRACELAAEGCAVGDVVAELASYRSEMTTLVLLNTLDNIVKGGRLSRFQGSLSKALDIRVLLRDADGEVVLLEKVHGHKKLLSRAVATIRGLRPDLSDRDVGITHFDNAADAETLRQALTEECNPRGFVVSEMGSTMATYAGEGGLIVSF